MADFTIVKQMEDIYAPCMTAEHARETEDWKSCVLAVKEAFIKLAEHLGKEDTTDYLQAIKDNTLLTDRSRATYLQYMDWNEDKAVKLDADNAIASLAEEVSKFAKYYCKGETPRTMQEIAEHYADGKQSTRGGRNQADGVFKFVLLMIIAGVGLGMIVASVLVPSLSHLLVGGVIALVFAFLFYTIGNNVKK